MTRTEMVRKEMGVRKRTSTEMVSEEMEREDELRERERN